MKKLLDFNIFGDLSITQKAIMWRSVAVQIDEKPSQINLDGGIDVNIPEIPGEEMAWFMFAVKLDGDRSYTSFLELEGIESVNVLELPAVQDAMKKVIEAIRVKIN